MERFDIDVGYVDPADIGAREYDIADGQLDVYDVLRLDAEERAYARAEREGKRLNDILCVECPDPGICAAEGECPR